MKETSNLGDVRHQVYYQPVNGKAVKVGKPFRFEGFAHDSAEKEDRLLRAKGASGHHYVGEVLAFPKGAQP